MIQSVVYTSNTGYTAQYAELLGEKTGLPVFPLEQAKKNLSPGDEILYLGWLMAGGIKGYKEAARKYKVRAVCAVGVSTTEKQREAVRKSNAVPDGVELFSLRGGFDIKKLHGIYKIMMLAMIKTVGKKLAEKQDRTPDEDAEMELMLHGGNMVSEENLRDVLAWYDREGRN